MKTPLRIRKEPFYWQYSAFEKAIENRIAFEKLFEWFLEQELDESLKQKEKPTYQDKALKAVKKAMLAMLEIDYYKEKDGMGKYKPFCSMITYCMAQYL